MSVSVPLYLLPRAIAQEISRMGDSVYSISIKRTHWHHYNISIRTKALPRELPPGSVVLVLPGSFPAYGDDGGAGSGVAECAA